MKTAIIFHSHYGNTSHVVNTFHDQFLACSEVDVFELHYKGGKKNVITRAFYRLFPAFVQIEPVKLNMQEYDIIFFGVAVMGGHPSSAMARYLSLCTNIKAKHVICCYVFSIEASKESCKRYVEDVIRAKGVKDLISLEVAWSKVLDKAFMSAMISDVKQRIFINP